MIEPTRLKYTRTHEWVHVKGKKIIVGITDVGQQLLSDITSIDLPEPDEHHYEAGEEIGVIESVKTSADFHAPVSGTIIATNTELLSRPELINSDPFGRGWIVEMAPDSMAELNSLMDIDEYEGSLPEEE
ncbi:MAG: glycine cleavage system protein GcvH [Kiritimatiellae bacterium]|nr:glycine cleavage system protein GcvH [Kiritimatiellia bacterium]MDD5520934.1 glycine cleavage system protein GcvH [Kiritimatiellia bacterium]